MLYVLARCLLLSVVTFCKVCVIQWSRTLLITPACPAPGSSRTVKSRALFTPENEMEKKPRGRGRRKGSGVTGRGRGRPRKLDAQGQIRRSGLQDLLEDEEAPLTDDAARDAYRRVLFVCTPPLVVCVGVCLCPGPV